MLGLYVTVPIVCFRKGQAREYLETEFLPPPSTCYGFLLSLVGETDRTRHIGCQVTAGRFGDCDVSVVLRTVWRVKKTPLGSAGNTRPDYQQLLSGVRLVIWVHSGKEAGDKETLEHRVRTAIKNPGSVSRYGGLSLGESTCLVDEVCLLEKRQELLTDSGDLKLFLLAADGRLTLPVWVDHVGSSGTRFATGNLTETSLESPPVERIPRILNE